MKRIAIVNGPNLDRLGTREPTIYGAETISDLEAFVTSEAERLGLEVVFFQSNHEGFIIDEINREYSKEDADVSGIIINPGALTHTSLALRDSLAGSGLPIVEVHISNIYKREEIRKHSMTAETCIGVISGLGFYGYVAALRFLAELEE